MKESVVEVVEYFLRTEEDMRYHRNSMKLALKVGNKLGRTVKEGTVSRICRLFWSRGKYWPVDPVERFLFRAQRGRKARFNIRDSGVDE